jgi:large subunit ribosomal protein L3
MIQGILGRKKGMTQVFDDGGKAVPVTLIEIEPCKVAQVKTVESDGYTAVQIGSRATTAKRIGKPRSGHLKKHGGLEPLKRLQEFRVDSVEGFESGQEIKLEEVFEEGERVDVRGRTKGRGFAGTIKRHNFQRGDVTHGGMAVRRPGAIGQCATPARVLKGKKMSGHMGDENQTVRNLLLFRIDSENRYVLVRGAVPGPINGEVVIRKTKKGVRAPKYTASK